METYSTPMALHDAALHSADWARKDAGTECGGVWLGADGAKSARERGKGGEESEE